MRVITASQLSVSGGWSAGVAAAVLVLGALVGWDRLLYPWQRLVQTFSRHDWSNLTRLYSMQAGWRAFLLSPIVGIGWGQFAFHFPLLVDPLGLQSQFAWPVVNNFPLAILCETGVTGFLVFTLCLGGLAGRIWRQAGRPVSVAPGPDRDVMIPATVAAVGVLAQLLTFSQWNLPHIWLALGLLLAATAGPDTRCEGRNRS